MLVGCEVPLDAEVWKRRGAEALGPFKKELQATLAEGMAESPAAAIQACRIKAPVIASSASTPTVEVGRTSHKLRNRDNAPREWVRPVLDNYVAASRLTLPQAVRIKGGGVGYVEPIYVKPMCLKCHGNAVADSLQLRIKELYPNDAATGFKAGDFRGLFWVEFDTED